MMFSCCHPRLPEEAQVALVPYIPCGFSVDEIGLSAPQAPWSAVAPATALRSMCRGTFGGSRRYRVLKAAASQPQSKAVAALPHPKVFYGAEG